MSVGLSPRVDGTKEEGLAGVQAAGRATLLLGRRSALLRCAVGGFGEDERREHESAEP